ncbi:proline racemase [Pseudoalteromonas ulvae UL12]|uniref:proline racemase family protein n=1 Tax=Pseudoalteromonas ulvae TaxID=107327 RepID=UPI00186B7F78|nr:proline racemase family protein [Pseudoalteromonas ulvae]MBE0364314.1 proline racemase [Pseudoalteromonas ulvae UL12]
MNSNSFADWQPPIEQRVITSLDMHTAGEPLRIVTAGFPMLDGETILEKRQFCLTHYDHLRTALMFEPRGHADMYGALITEPERPQSDFGVLFLHNEGYSTMCGHAIIALSKAAVEANVIDVDEGINLLKIDTPAGLIESQVLVEQGRVMRTSFRNVPSFLALADQWLDVEGVGRVQFDLAYGGAFYAFVDADTIGLSLGADNSNQIIMFGQQIKQAVMKSTPVSHPFADELSFLYGVIFTSEQQTLQVDSHSRHVCIFANGELDRSPTGTGVSARAALCYAKGQLHLGDEINIESILGSQFSVSVHSHCQFGPYQAIVPEVSGTAFVTGKNEFYFDLTDPLSHGFIFR